MSNKDLYIRSSSAEFLIFEQQKKEHGIEVRFEDGDLWQHWENYLILQEII